MYSSTCFGRPHANFKFKNGVVIKDQIAILVETYKENVIKCTRHQMYTVVTCTFDDISVIFFH